MTSIDRTTAQPGDDLFSYHTDLKTFSVEQITDYLMMIHRLARSDYGRDGVKHAVSAWMAALNGNQDHAAVEQARYRRIAFMAGVPVDETLPIPVRTTEEQ